MPDQTIEDPTTTPPTITVNTQLDGITDIRVNQLDNGHIEIAWLAPSGHVTLTGLPADLAYAANNIGRDIDRIQRRPRPGQ